MCDVPQIRIGSCQNIVVLRSIEIDHEWACLFMDRFPISQSSNHDQHMKQFLRLETSKKRKICDPKTSYIATADIVWNLKSELSTFFNKKKISKNHIAHIVKVFNYYSSWCIMLKIFWYLVIGLLNEEKKYFSTVLISFKVYPSIIIVYGPSNYRIWWI